MKQKIRKLLRRHKDAFIQTEDSGVPRITNETVAAHREEMLGRARKYIYPLQHSKHRVVLISTGIIIVVIIGFFSYCTLALYRFESSSSFLYRVTQVVPFPIARSGGHFIAYENYLFELRHYTHYYITQQKLDFNTPEGKQQLADFQRRALDKVINDSYIKKLAAKHKLSVSDGEVNDQIVIVRSQNRLGGSDKVFEDVLRDYWGWSINDFKRSLRAEMLTQKVVGLLDTETVLKAQTALNELNSGADFAATAKKYSDDAATKENGGEYGYPIDRTTRTLSAQATNALFKLKPGQISDIINTGLTLELLKNIETNGEKIRAAHIVFVLKDINVYVNDLKDKQKTRTFIDL